jgi:cytochrome c oxidase assembly protein subunit 15
MIHRYLAGSLGLAILALSILAWSNRKQPPQPLLPPSVLLLPVIFQAALGMWTVTLLVKPPIVTAHLLGGFANLALLWLLVLRLKPRSASASASGKSRQLMVLSLLVVVVQITLGGWTSTNYAALGCFC